MIVERPFTVSLTKRETVDDESTPALNEAIENAATVTEAIVTGARSLLVLAWILLSMAELEAVVNRFRLLSLLECGATNLLATRTGQIASHHESHHPAEVRTAVASSSTMIASLDLTDRKVERKPAFVHLHRRHGKRRFLATRSPKHVRVIMPRARDFTEMLKEARDGHPQPASFEEF
jgi:hypothetical protein